VNRAVHRGVVANDDDDDDDGDEDDEDDDDSSAADVAADAMLLVASNKWSLSMTRLSTPQHLHTDTRALLHHMTTIE